MVLGLPALGCRASGPIAAFLLRGKAERNPSLACALEFLPAPQDPPLQEYGHQAFEVAGRFANRLLKGLFTIKGEIRLCRVSLVAALAPGRMEATRATAQAKPKDTQWVDDS